MLWVMLNGAQPDILGFIPHFLNEDDPRPAREQFDANYSFGGGWETAPFTLNGDDRLCYPGDPPLTPLAEAWLRRERILVFESAWVVVIQPDGRFIVQRMD